MSAALPILLRIMAVIAGGYAAMIGMVALLSVLLVLVFGIVPSEALLLSSMIGFVAYAAIILLGWAEQRLMRLWAVLVGVALTSHAAAMLLAPLLPATVGGG